MQNKETTPQIHKQITLSTIMTSKLQILDNYFQFDITQLYSPFEKAAQLYAKNECENVTNQQHKTLKRYLAQSTQ